MGTDSLDDKTLVQETLARISNGETSAFERIVRQYERALRAWLAAHVPPGIDVDEIAQRSFVAAYSRLNEFEPGTNFAAWLFTIARFQLRTETTRLRRIADYHARYGPDLLQRELDRRADEPPEIWSVKLELLQKCLETLGEHSREFVKWRYEEEIPLEEMSTRSGRSVAAIKKHLWSLRQQLHHCIKTRLATVEGEAQ